MDQHARHAPAQDSQEQHDCLLTTGQLAKRYTVPASTIYRWRACGDAPRAIRVGKHLRFRLSDVLAWECDHLDGRRPA